MKIYFAASIRSGRDDVGIYQLLIERLGAFGQVLTEHIGDQSLSIHGEQKPSEFIFQRDTDWVREADVVVAEVTTPSLGVGYEIRLGEELGKRVICLYRPQSDRKLSAMILGNPRLSVVEYDGIEDAVEKLKELLA